MSEPRVTAAGRWAADLAGWAIPDHILAQAPADPWVLTPRMFTAPDPDAVPDTAARRRALEALPEGGTVLDVGAGGGAASLALIPPAGRLVAVDASRDMLDALGARATERGIDHELVHGAWPDVAGAVGPADVVVCHHVAYNVPALVPFVTALTDHARARVVLVLTGRHPVSGSNALWRHFWDLERPERPTADGFLAVMAEMGIEVGVEREERPWSAARDGEWAASLTRRLCLGPERQPEVEALVATLPDQRVREAVTVWWAGRAPSASAAAS